MISNHNSLFPKSINGIYDRSYQKIFFWLKTHLTMIQERMITAAFITKGEQNDGKYLQQLDIKKREICPFREGCYTEDSKSKTNSGTIK